LSQGLLRHRPADVVLHWKPSRIGDGFQGQSSPGRQRRPDARCESGLLVGAWDLGCLGCECIPECAVRRLVFEWRWEAFVWVLSWQGLGAEGSLTGGLTGRVASGPDEAVACRYWQTAQGAAPDVDCLNGLDHPRRSRWPPPAPTVPAVPAGPDHPRRSRPSPQAPAQPIPPPASTVPGAADCSRRPRPSSAQPTVPADPELSPLFVVWLLE
jgi:hypothetical protein